MASYSDHDLRRLAKTFRVAFQPQISSDQWPAQHKDTFEDIKTIGKQEYEKYCANVDIRSREQPWKQKTKHRAAWLAERTSHLLNQQRNEAGWRFGLENEVLSRFAVEVACYEIGTNPLFDDRAQEVILHGTVLRSHLPKQEPDRVYGLQLTRNFENALSQPMANPPEGKEGYSIGECIRTSPFKEGIEPLIFPFLILEAKAEKSSNGFMDIQTQTMFPIQALLKLQEDLQHDPTEANVGPLVWFLAYRGDSWRVYSCYVTNDKPARYNIIQLWDGCILSKDSSLQLLLIIDYIFDWARDLYRPSILRVLKSLATGQAYDQISLSNDSDIFSLRRHISSWAEPTPSKTFGVEPSIDDQTGVAPPDKEKNRLDGLIPELAQVTTRSASMVRFRVVGLCLDERCAVFLKEIANTIEQPSASFRSEARSLINFMTQWSDLIILNFEDLSKLDETWTGKAQPHCKATTSDPDGTFYTLIEFTSYINQSWEVVQEILYIAISKRAFNVLVDYAAYSNKHHGISALSEISRACDEDILHDTVTCLRAGSYNQVLLSALTCSSFALYPLPNQQCTDANPLITVLGFGPLRHSRLRDLVSKFQKFGELAYPKKWRLDTKIGSEAKMRAVEERDHTFPEYKGISLVRTAEGHDNISRHLPHEVASCNRCQKLAHKAEDCSLVREAAHVEFSANGLVIVDSLNLEEDFECINDICLFATENGITIESPSALGEIVEELLQNEKIYHTIRHPLPASFYKKDSVVRVFWRDTIWNLPSPLRPPTTVQRLDIAHLINKLKSKRTLIGVQCTRGGERNKEQSENWDILQLSLHSLKQIHNWGIATEWVDYARSNLKNEMQRSDSSPRLKLYKKMDQEELETRRAAGIEEEQDVWSMRSQAPRLNVGDGDLKHYSGSKWNGIV